MLQTGENFAELTALVARLRFCGVFNTTIFITVWWSLSIVNFFFDFSNVFRCFSFFKFFFKLFKSTTRSSDTSPQAIWLSGELV